MDLEFLNNIKKEKVVIMLSGGKDSAACLHLLKLQGADVIAIHFVHKWGYRIVTDEAKRICWEYNVPLTIYDYSNEFIDSLKGFKGGRPCLLCKEIMYEITLKFALEEKAEYICVGDNANDTTTITRIRKNIDRRSDETLFLNTFLDRDITLSNNIKIIRPIVNMTSEEVLQYLEKNNISIQRVGDTGDKYFEYSREGCPIQFHDPGIEITAENMGKLWQYNTILSKFARENSIRASIHIPSEFIVTIPRGFEEKAKNYLLSRGVALKSNEKNTMSNKYFYMITMKSLYIEMFQTEVIKYLINRFFERLDVEVDTKHSLKLEKSGTYLYEGSMVSSNVYILQEERMISLFLISNRKYKESYIENLIIEVFRTTRYTLNMDEV